MSLLYTIFCTKSKLVIFFFFFFQAEDGIRDYKVTGVQTCALPISDVAGQSPYWIDSIQCTRTPTALNTGAQYNFEEGFVPPEVTGNFQIDNSLPYAGVFSAHPPTVGGAQKSVINFSCGCKANAGISFYYALINPATGQDVKFYVDNQLYATYGRTNDCCHNFDNKIIDLPSGHHDYRWEVSTTGAGQAPFWLDSVKC